MVKIMADLICLKSDRRPSIVVCVNRRLTLAQPSCAARGGEDLMDQLKDAARRRNIPVSVESFECFGLCNQGPNLRFSPAGPFFSDLSVDSADWVLDRWEAWLPEVED